MDRLEEIERRWRGVKCTPQRLLEAFASAHADICWLLQQVRRARRVLMAADALASAADDYMHPHATHEHPLQTEERLRQARDNYNRAAAAIRPHS